MTDHSQAPESSAKKPDAADTVANENAAPETAASPTR